MQPKTTIYNAKLSLKSPVIAKLKTPSGTRRVHIKDLKSSTENAEQKHKNQNLKKEP